MSSSPRENISFSSEMIILFFLRFDFKWSNEENHVSKTNTTCEYIYERHDQSVEKSNYLHMRERIFV